MIVTGPDNKAYNLPDDATDAEIISLFGETAPQSKSLLQQGVDAVKGAGANIAAGINDANAAFLETAAKGAEKVGELTGTTPGGGFREGAKSAREGAQYWKNKAVETGVTPESIPGKIYSGIGGAPMGLAEFAAGVPFAVARGAADDGMTGAVKSGLERFALGKVFKGIEKMPVSSPSKAAIMGGTMGAQTAAEGGNLEDVVASTVTGAALTIPGAGGGKADVIRQTLQKGGVQPGIAADLATRAATIPDTPRPTHDNLAEGIPASDSLDLQNVAPEVKPVVKGTKPEILALKKQGGTEGKVIYTAGDVAYIIDPTAVQGIYGGSKAEAIRKAKLDLKKGGDAESNLLGYPDRENTTPDQTIDAAVTKTGEVVTDLPTMKAEKEAGNIAWAAEGKPEEVTAKAEGVAAAITKQPYDQARAQELKNSIVEGQSILDTGMFNGKKRSKEYLEAVKRSVASTQAKLDSMDQSKEAPLDPQPREAPQVTGGQPDIQKAVAAVENLELWEQHPLSNEGKTRLLDAVDKIADEYGIDRQELRKASIYGPTPGKVAAPETTSIKNAVTDTERATDNLHPIESPVGGTKSIPSMFEEGKALVDRGEFGPSTVGSIIKTPRQISDSENMALLYMKQRNRNAHDTVTERIIEARQAGDVQTIEALKAERDAIETERQAIDSAAKAAGTEWGRSGRARQEEIAQDYTLQRNIQRARAESPTGEITEAHRAEIESLTARLEAVMKETETKDEKIATLQAEMALKQLAREEGAARRKGVRTAKVVTLDAEFSGLAKELNAILNPDKLNMALDPAAIPVLVKMAKNRVQKGMTKVADVVDDIYNALEGKIDKREITLALANYDGKSDAPARKLKAKEEELKRQIDASVAPLTAGKKARAVFTEAWKAGLLSGPKTHIVNITSNALTVGLKPVESLIASGAEALRAQATGQNRGAFAGEALADIVGMRAGIDEGFRRAARGWAEALPPEEAMKHNESQQMYAIPGRTGKIVRIPFRALTAADGFFKAIAQSSEVYRLAYKQAATEGLKGDALKTRMAEIIQNPDAKIIDASIKEADYRTFNSQFGPFGKWVSSARKIPYVGFLADILMPFIRTPVNIAKYGLERTPVNFGRLLYKAFKGQTRGTALSEELAKPIMGTMITAAVVNGVISGNITGGGPKDKADREALLRTGWQPYSFKIGDTYYSYNRFEPIGMVVGTSADFADMAFGNESNVRNAIDAANAVAMSIAKNWTSKTFMQSLSAALDATSDPGRYGKSFINQYAGSLIPAGVNAVTTAIDDSRRDVIGPIDAIQSRIPGASEGLEVKRDLWGREIKKAGLSPVDRSLSPMIISKETGDLVDKTILRLGLSPGMPMRKIKGNELTPEQYSQYVAESGQRAYKIVARIAASNMSDEAKRRNINNAISEQREIVGYKLMREWGMRPLKRDSARP